MQEGRTVTRFMTKLWLAMRSKKGQSLVEYALILALVAIVVITALTTLGGHASNAMNSVATDLGNAVP
jgi:pilus assembly protein Flp/PilA